MASLAAALIAPENEDVMDAIGVKDKKPKHLSASFHRN
jgi:hypothetical protein